MTKVQSILPINGSIAPQTFEFRENKFTFFERINSDEGRFFTIENGEINIKSTISQSHGIIENGEFFTIEIGDVTTIKRLGENPLKIEINGPYFDFKVDSGGNIICLGHDGESTLVKIYDKSGCEKRTILVNSIFFGSCIKILGEEIWIGGFNKENKFQIISMNYIGNCTKTYTLTAKADNRLISNIKISKGKIYAHITGNTDSIYILDADGNKLNEVFPATLDLNEFAYFDVLDNSILILSGKNIYTFLVQDLISSKPKGFLRNVLRLENIKLPYAYFLGMKALTESFLSGVICSVFIYMIIYILGYRDLNPLQAVFTLWVISTGAAVIFSIFKIKDKSKRITYLLKINQKSISNTLERTLFLNTISLSIISLLFMYNLRIINFVMYVLIIIFTFMIDRALEGLMNRKNEDIVVELLKGDTSLNNSLRDLINSCEDGKKILINIITESPFSQNHIHTWKDSREAILGNEMKFVLFDKTFVSVVDLSKRDIKYSKLSIVSDLICFLGNKSTIKEVKAMWID